MYMGLTNTTATRSEKTIVHAGVTIIVHPAFYYIGFTVYSYECTKRTVLLLLCARSVPRILILRPIRGRTVRASHSRFTVRASRSRLSAAPAKS